jgi:fatty acid synthase subunit beta
VLRGEIEHYREHLSNIIKVEDVKHSELVQRWIPNVVGKPFALEKSYLEEVQRITGSDVLRAVIKAL